MEGGLRPDSDLDLLAIVDGPVGGEARSGLVGRLIRISAPSGGTLRPVELIVFRQSDLSPVFYPARCEFIYGEWLRAGFEAGHLPQPASDPEFTLVLAQARLNALVLTGSSDLLPAIPQEDVRRAIGDALPALLSTLEGDERNVLLTLARMWRTLVRGDFLSKDAAADWAISRLPEADAAVIATARDAYLGVMSEDWQADRAEIRRVAEALAARVRTESNRQKTTRSD